VANPDPEVSSRWNRREAIYFPSARPDLGFRICLCTQLVCEDACIQGPVCTITRRYVSLTSAENATKII